MVVVVIEVVMVVVVVAVVAIVVVVAAVGVKLTVEVVGIAVLQGIHFQHNENLSWQCFLIMFNRVKYDKNYQVK